MPVLSHRYESCVGKLRFGLLRRLATTGYRVTPLIVDEYSQMTIDECRKHVLACEKQIPQNVDQALGRGFIFKCSIGKASARGKRVYGKALFVTRNRRASRREIIIPFDSRYLYGAPRLRRSGERL